MTDERWQPIPDFEHYMISDYGRIKNIRTDKLKQPSIMKASKHHSAFLQVALSNGKRQRVDAVHRLVARSFLGASPPGYVCRAKNDDYTDCRLDNLEYTKKGNTIAKIPDSEYENIINLHREGKTYTEIAARYDVSRDTISRLVKKATSPTETTPCPDCGKRMILVLGELRLTNPPQQQFYWYCGGCEQRHLAYSLRVATFKSDRQRWLEANEEN